MDHNGAIVVGLGDREDGVPELTWAAREAQVRRLPLHILRAYHMVQATMPWETSFDAYIEDELRAVTQKRLERAAGRVTADWPDVDVQLFATKGVPANVLVDAAAQAELVVVGSRRRGAVGAAVLGSVSSRVAAIGEAPVVVVLAPPGDPAELPWIVAGIDGSDVTQDVLAFAFDFASRHGRELQVVFCWPHDLLAEMAWRNPPPPPDRAERWLGEAVAGWQAKYPDVVVHRAVVRADPVDGLVEASASQDLLVVGARGRRSRVAALLGSVSQGVLHYATCPVAVVHPSAERDPG